MNPQTAHLWFYILLMFTILSFEVLETDGGLMDKFREWRDRCRQKFEYFKVLYNIWKHAKNFPLNSLDMQDLVLLNDTIQKLFDHKNYDKVNKVQWRNRTFMGRMYDFCSRPMRNLTDLLKEIKTYKTSKSVSKSTKKSSLPGSKLKKVLDTCTQSRYDRAPIAHANTLPNPESVTQRIARKWNWMNFTRRNEDGQLELVELCLDNVARANLSTLINWLYVTEDMTFMLQDLKQKGDVETIKQSFGIFDSNDKRDPLQMIENAVQFFQDLENSIHRELRKPEKDWNYSKEED